LAFKACQGTKNLIGPTKIIIRTCPSCSNEVEFFSDETEAKCEKCGHILRQEVTPSCITWCEYAEKCIDDMKTQGMISSSRAEELFKVIPHTIKNQK
jgi:DNA-directed RNA polymerase subunit RPC12/RpoP